MKILHLSDPVHGWINITFGKEPDSYTLTASDVPNDCLLDLAAATIRIMKGSVFESVQFSLEPNFATCELHRESESVRISIRHPDHIAVIFEAAFPLQAFAHRLRFELLRIESRYSTDDGWTQPFPHREVKHLSYEN
jgi:hypothetical protein